MQLWGSAATAAYPGQLSPAGFSSALLGSVQSSANLQIRAGFATNYGSDDFPVPLLARTPVKPIDRVTGARKRFPDPSNLSKPY